MSSRLFVATLSKQAAAVSRRATFQSAAARVAPQLVRMGAIAGSRTFATSRSGKRLKEVLKSELKISNAIPNELDSSYKDFIDRNGFQILESEGTSNVQLIKQGDNGETIRVFFDIDEVTDVPMSQVSEEGVEAEFEEGFEGEAEALDSLLCNIKVLIEKPATNDGLFINLFLQNTENSFMIDFVNHQEDVKQFLEEQILKKGEFIDKFKYQGPRFSDLDESVQTEFENYLAAKGIDDELADFIISYSEFKEENEYRSWLSSLTKFLN
ncbi:mitochondrial acidic matrix protein [Scheffersomyces stipitis CBS 6054]|uniref:Mitochondrial acidic matrix protein n=1 Tax=Scheffersomyces stipitis (strain ATCC 58785 / CBS 6054 / NBRC 10063 / NRRL Y-11545) TaxID=322104 RepID=A3LPH0_PICST|nr:mitochondrial acidic matrix protein [Scheffersomyces stipitis CBS 6054]ABN65044.1 mitochondrial acidic matrix protein [Scheffersomyces stipitis CBS 6054]